MGRDVGVAGLLFEMGVKVDAHVDACTHECSVDYTAYDGALEAEPRLLKQTRNFLLCQPAPTNQTFQAGGMRRCDARGARRYHQRASKGGKSQNLLSPIQFQTYW
jgi:hypothetical protein